MDADTIISAAHVHYDIDGAPILRDVSFAVQEGEYLSILGPNGAGKTTLLKCLNGIVRNWQGEIRVGGDDVKKLQQREIARKLGYVPQLRDSPAAFTVRDFMLMSRYAYCGPFNPPSKTDYAVVSESLELTDMTAFAERRLSTLSGGECQKVYIAAALAQQAPVVLLDEPISFLDPRYQYEINRLLKQLNRDTRLTIVAVSHDINSAVLNSDRILALKQGRIVFWGSVREVMEPGTLQSIFDTEFTFAQHPVAGIPVVVPEH